MDKQIIILTTDWLHALGQLRSMHVETRRVNQRIFLVVVDVRVGVCVCGRAKGMGMMMMMMMMVWIMSWEQVSGKKNPSEWVSEWVSLVATIEILIESEFGVQVWFWFSPTLTWTIFMLLLLLERKANYSWIRTQSSQDSSWLKMTAIKFKRENVWMVKVWECPLNERVYGSMNEWENFIPELIAVCWP